MTPEEIHVRSNYLFLACAQVVDHVTERLMTTLPPPPLTAKPMLEQAMKRELGMLVRHWITRKVWEQLERDEEGAKNLNLALLRLFTDGFRLPRDGSGLRYAGLLTLTEEAQELDHRLSRALGMSHLPLRDALQGAISTWHETILRQTTDALALSPEQLRARLKHSPGRAPSRGETK